MGKLEHSLTFLRGRGRDKKETRKLGLWPEKGFFNQGAQLLTWVPSMDGDIDVYKHFAWLKRVSEWLLCVGLRGDE